MSARFFFLSAFLFFEEARALGGPEKLHVEAFEKGCEYGKRLLKRKMKNSLADKIS
jgi:hypothetical protein